MHQEHVEYVVEGLLPKGGQSILAAPPKCGKSTLARCLAAEVAGVGSGEWMGRKVEHGKVLFLTLEGPPAVCFEHLRQLGPSEDRLAVVTQLDKLPPVDCRAAALEHALELHRPALVIIDTLEQFYGFDEINSYSEVSKAMRPANAIAARTGAHIMFIHHCGKDSPGVSRRHGAEMLGSTALAGCVDTVLILKWSDGERRQVYSTNRTGEALPATVLRQSEDGWIHAIGERAALEQATVEDRVLRCIHDAEGWIGTAAIKTDVEARNQKIARALERLTEAGVINRRKCGRATEYCSAIPSLGTGTEQQANLLTQ